MALAYGIYIQSQANANICINDIFSVILFVKCA